MNIKIKKWTAFLLEIIISLSLFFMGFGFAYTNKFVAAEEDISSGAVLPGNVSDEGLAAYWKFDDNTNDGSVSDETKYARNLWMTDGGTATWVESKDLELGKAFQFDGHTILNMHKKGATTEDANKTDAGYRYSIDSSRNPDGSTKGNSALNGDESVSFSYLMRIDNFTENTDQGYNVILSTSSMKGAGTLAPGVVQNVILDNTKITSTAPIYDENKEHQWLLATINGPQGGVTGADVVRLEQSVDNKFNGEWNLFTYVFEDVINDDVAISSGKLYINGSLVLECELSNSAGLTKIFGKSDEPLNIGGLVEGSTVKRCFEGALDELMIFTRALQQDEIEKLARAYGYDPSNGYDSNPDQNPGDTTDSGSSVTNNGLNTALAVLGGAGGGIVAGIAVSLVVVFIVRRKKD